MNCLKGDTAMVNVGRRQNEDDDDVPIVGADDDSLSHSQQSETESQMSLCTRYITVGVLFFVNLLNYMDRYTIAGVLDDVKDYYKINDAGAGILQAIFIIGYMCFSPIFGYCGDRYNRKYLMTGGILFWSAITLAGSFVPANAFGAFVFLRGLVGIGEASYSTIAPTIISDLFVKDKRSLMLMLFYFAIPVGSGLGYIVGANLAPAFSNLFGGGYHWQWALRVTPALGVICCLLIMIVTKEPPRGMAEHAAPLHRTTVKQDIIALVKNKSFVLDTLGFTCVAFIAGALALFAPSFIHNAYKKGGHDIELRTVSLYFGIITASAGFLGILIGSRTATYLKRRYPNADALVCAAGLFLSAPFLFIALVVCEFNMVATWILILLGMTMICLNWSLVADIVLYTVVPTRRSTAEAMQIFFSHLLGDAGSPYLLGQLSVALEKTGLDEFQAMQRSLYTCIFVGVLGGGFFLACSLFVERDRAKADAVAHGSTEQEAEGIITPVPITDSFRNDAQLIVA